MHSRATVLEGVVLEDDDAVEEAGAGRDVAPGLEAVQARVLVRPGLQLLGLERLQPLRERLVRRHPGADRHGVDEQTDHGFHAGQFGGAAGDRRAEHDVPRSAVARQQQRPRALDQRVQGQPVVLGHLGQLLGQAGGQREVDRSGGLGAVRLGRLPVVGQRGGRVEPGERGAPVRLGRVGVLFRQPGHVLAEGAAGFGLYGAP